MYTDDSWPLAIRWNYFIYHLLKDIIFAENPTILPLASCPNHWWKYVRMIHEETKVINGYTEKDRKRSKDVFIEEERKRTKIF